MSKHTATGCNRPQQAATGCSSLPLILRAVPIPPMMSTQHTATHCNTLQHSATLCPSCLSSSSCSHSSIAEHTATNCNTLQPTSTNCTHTLHCNTLHHIATHCPSCHELFKLLPFLHKRVDFERGIIALCLQLLQRLHIRPLSVRAQPKSHGTSHVMSLVTYLNHVGRGIIALCLQLQQCFHIRPLPSHVTHVSHLNRGPNALCLQLVQVLQAS